jgi:hypothetical protein
MCTANSQKYLPDFLTSTEGHTKDDSGPTGGPIRKATEVPLGDGMADAAKTAILSRRERIRRAVDGDGDPNAHIRRD